MAFSRALGVVALCSLAACDGLKEALTAHVDVVASAGSQELSVQQLTDLMGKSQVPIRKDVARSIADLWVNYQLVGRSAIELDSLKDHKLIDEVMWPVYTNSISRKYFEKVAATWSLDTTNLASKYEKSEVLAARHILFQIPQGQEATGSDSILKKAQGVLARTTKANFAQMAKQYGSDGTKDTGGDLGVFGPGAMVADFYNGVASTKPGEIGGLVRTQFGYHIVWRPTYDEVKDQWNAEFVKRQRMVAESTFMAGMEKAANIEMKPTLARTVKAVAADPEGSVGDGTPVAKWKHGTFAAKDVARWVGGFPNADQMRAQIAQQPDSILQFFVKGLIQSEMILRAADSAKVTVDSTERENVYQSFAAILNNVWTGLQVAPSILGDSAKTKADREKLVPGRLNDFLGRVVNGTAQYVEVPQPLATALRKKYDWKVNIAGLDRAVTAATALRAKEDSAKGAAMPKSAVPMPAPTDTGAKK